MTTAFLSSLRAFARTAAVLALAAAPLAMSAWPVLAQGTSLFEPVLKINGMAITRYELEQRKLFLRLLRSPGDPETEALRGLTQDRLAAAEAKRLGLRLTPRQMAAGMEEFAGRANLSTEQFVEALAQAGVQAETFRDFVGNGLLFRELVRGRFLPSVSISEAEIDRAIETVIGQKPVQLLMSEIILPVEGDPAPQLEVARRLKAEISSEAGFAAAARRYSASPSAGRGGRLDWTPASNLPPQIVQLVLQLGPGQVSDPITLPNAVAIFQLRDVTEDTSAKARTIDVEYAEFLLPNTPEALAEAAALGNRLDSCKDLYAETRGLPADRLTVSTRTMAEIPSDVGLQLAQLDAGEYSSALTRGGWRVFLMLCGRAPQPELPPGAIGVAASADDAPAKPAINRAALREQLTTQKLTALAEGYLEELRSEAFIETP
ncbi:MAG: peptidylprolyl isomerase [Rhodobacteraceae bacterium]|nr:peptidylprolyl isomerase [Paracoccaceae bacterium]